LPGWYASKSLGGNTITEYRAGTGSDTVGGLYSFGDSGSPERALGSLASGTPGNIAFGVRLLNDTASPQTNFVISYTGEQWRVANATMQKLTFSYRTGISLTNADAPGSQNWTAFPALDFNSPDTEATKALNGNDPTNRVVFSKITLPGVALQPGQELFLRWFDRNDASYDDALAIDNLTVSFGTISTNPPPPDNVAFSLLTYNVAGNGVADWSTNSPQVQAIGRELMYLDPDIITFNEIPYTNTYQMANWMMAFLPGYFLATNSVTDGYIRSVIANRFPIARSKRWLAHSSLAAFGYSGVFTRDLFEAEIDVPGFPQPLHVFVTHLKATSGTPYQDDADKRAAEASAISNFFATTYLTGTSQFQPYIVSGDMNEDIYRPDTAKYVTGQPIQRITSPPTGLKLTTPVNPTSDSDLTLSIRGTLDVRFDYILPCALLFSNINTSQVFRTDLLSPVPPGLLSDDDKTASDHLPVLMVFNNPYNQPFHVLSVARTNQTVMLQWQSVIGQSYHLEVSPDLTNWTTYANDLVATGANFTFSTNVSGDQNFFRVYRWP
ncbi:MAG TPA: hypothetical protein VKA67_07815, partial [Verrucomicrobiae bacterium]|nr:hypothetical protein [Verrucomicrobiae bacterium]